MSDEDSPQAPLERLRQRWAGEPSPRLAVRLAEELHRQGETAEAVGILEKGLAQQPDHLAARVALGRYRIELGDLEAARRTLETVVDRDPTHLVANRLLVDLYIRLGETDLARDRLDLYILLNDRDPEIEALERRLAGEPEVAVPPEEPAIEPEVPEAEPEPPAVAAEPPEVAAEAAELEVPAIAPPEFPAPELPAPTFGEPEFLDRAPEHPAEPFDLEPAGAPGADLAAAEGPFAGLWTSALAGRYWQQIAAEGIFPRASAAVAETEAIPAPAPAAPGEPPAPAPAPGRAAQVVEEATVTLAALYRKQGHLEEAARIYRRVLERHPDNAAARAGLSAVTGASAAGESGAAAGEPSARAPATALERKKAALLDYLRRIRGGAGEPA